MDISSENSLKESASPESKTSYTPPKGARASLSITASGREFSYQAEADWIILRKDEKPMAEMFFTSYTAVEGADRPLTFVFNGGPGSSSVYLHFGALGPRRAVFGPRGEPLPPPHKLLDNQETWLRFTDLVFIDPVGTGLSRMIPDPDAKKDTEKKDPEEKKDVEYWSLKRDLESICEFIRKYLSRTKRWDSPVYLAGESYGGFRAAKLVRLLQQDYGVALAGAVLISPALEFTLLDSSDYDDLPWLDTFPTMAGAAFFHDRARGRKLGESRPEYVRRAAKFAVRELLPVLAGGDMVGETRRDRILAAAADFLGLPRDIVRNTGGRVAIEYFSKNLLRDRGLVLGLYDASATVKDPYPDRDEWSGPDSTLHVVERVFAAGVNSHLRAAIGLETDRDYSTSSDEVNENWKIDTRKHAFESQVGATDDLRYGMSVNPHMKVYLTHGVFDLVTPFFTAERISRLMKLDEDRKRLLTVRHYDGGHMFYTWETSRIAFSRDMEAFFTAGNSEPT